MLGVFLLPAFTRQGHERQDLLSPCMCAQTRPRFILSSERGFFLLVFFFFFGGGGGGGERNGV